MSDDKDITRELWSSRLPICFILSEEDMTKVNRSELPEPLYLMLSRHIYFPFILDKISRYFSTYYKVDSSNSNNSTSSSNINLNNIWLEFEGIPLKWHYPIGVLYDLYTNDLTLTSSTSSSLPWQITVHFTKFPETELIRFPDKESIEAHYMSTLKEADSLKHKGKIIGDMQKRDHKQLWNSLAQDKYDQFWNINAKLMSYTENLQYFRYIPFRLYRLDKPFIQKLFSPFDTNTNSMLTLGDLVQFALINEAACDVNNELNLINTRIEQFRIIIHGTQPSLQTPVQWLSEYFSYPDNFLHICLVDK
ncbi:unnamed protein product [Didymodactylos carnosus]|uniref:Autophagy protein 5 n=1 Tax=Didymodactylos carnosus TaxID=1234261 RepID=A0A813S5F0_9BILA|nr:unnamed protein product [Didymodactylos carnosus]CAF0903140.1 unnamed protein product [Didymodactylos carnosus]CAF3574587.1 unnamed protein product [Didymodactylos carnosus]CAF3683491.1 unnamed protein product [Didymodactylos carnosus]